MKKTLLNNSRNTYAIMIGTLITLLVGYAVQSREFEVVIKSETQTIIDLILTLFFFATVWKFRKINRTVSLLFLVLSIFMVLATTTGFIRWFNY